MSVRFGRCRTPLTCSVAESRVVLRLWENEPFFCPECARPLAEAPPWESATAYRSRMLVAGLLLMVASAGSAAWLLLQPGVAPRQVGVAAALAHAAVLAPAKPGVVMTTHLPQVIRVAPPPAPAAIPAAPQFPPPHLAMAATPHRVAKALMAQPKPVPPKLAQPKPVQSKPVQSKPVQSKPEQPQLAQLPSAQPLAATLPQVVKAPEAVPAPAPAPLAKPPAVVQATAPTAPPGPRKIVLPAGSQLSFGPLEGVNLSALPPRMIFANPAATRKPGSIDVDCKIGLDGIPADCRKVADHGGGEVSDTILAWLGSGAIRYSPTIKDGRKIVARRILTVNFGGAKEP